MPHPFAKRHAAPDKMVYAPGLRSAAGRVEGRRASGEAAKNATAPLLSQKKKKKTAVGKVPLLSHCLFRGGAVAELRRQSVLITHMQPYTCLHRTDFGRASES